MTRDDVKIGYEIVGMLKKIDDAICQTEIAIEKIIKNDDQAWACLAAHEDGSGWNIKLFGTGDAVEYVEAIKNILHKNKEVLEKKLSEI